jgi:hypothetical protein
MSLVVVVPASVLREEEAQRLGILVACCAVLIGILLYGVAQRVNKIRHWPKSWSENILILSFLVCVPMIPFTAWAIIFLIFGMCCAAAISPKFLKDLKKQRAEQDESTVPSKAAPSAPSDVR